MLNINDLHSYYSESYILQGLSFNVSENEVVVILGRNGVGKTTLIHSIVSFVVPSQGKILFNGENITGVTTHEIIRKGIGLVPQGRRIFPSLSVIENLSVPYLSGTSLPGKRAVWDIDLVLHIFPNLKARQKTKAGQLSGGEQQMLAIARALMTGPKLLLMDEPSEGLSPMIVNEVGKIVLKLREQGLGILLVEQNLQFALSVADRAYVMSRGQIVHESSPEALQGNEEVKSRYLGV